MADPIEEVLIPSSSGLAFKPDPDAEHGTFGTS